MPKNSVGEVLREFAAGKLHSGSKKGPTVHSRRQAVAIGLSEVKLAKKQKLTAGTVMTKLGKARMARGLDCRSPNCAQPS